MARYELLERIGAGGMAEIFRGKATAGGGFEKPVAIKRILPHLSQDKRFVEMLITEAKTLSQLRHRNVVQIYDVGLGDDGQYFLVMEFVDGVDLGALYEALEDTGLRLPLPIALHIAGEVCEALDHAHRARSETGQPLGLVHRDVTPSNILLSISGEVKLTDFGIAKRMEEATGHGGVRGKFAYIAPEQAINTHVDARSDVYSLGVVLFELVIGKRLYSQLPDFDALRAVREARPFDMAEEHPELDPELGRILERALAPDPNQRYPSAGNFGSVLRSYRYSIESAMGDPSTEVAHLVASHLGGTLEAAAPPAREPTVVRIATAAGFSGRWFEDDDSGPRRTPADLFDDEATHAIAPHAVHDVATGRLAFEDVHTHPLVTPDFRVGEASGSGLAEASTRILPVPASAGAGRSAPPADELESPPGRAPTPTMREVFFRGGLLDDTPQPAFPGGVITPVADDGRISRRRRRAILIAGVVSIACAVGAFVVVGALLGKPIAGAVPVDAAPAEPIDAAAAGAAAAHDAGIKPDRPRPKRKKKPTTKAGKTGGKTGKTGKKKPNR